ncbi:MAG: hypothetical protein QXU52_01620 [Fervidicoccaceae archaeon]
MYQDIYVVSAEPVRLCERIPGCRNVVIGVRASWSVPVRVGFSFNAALLVLKARGVRVEDYDYIFKVDGDVTLPDDYLENLISKRPLVAGFGAALLISKNFFRYALGGMYPINECDDGYVLARSVAMTGLVVRYDGPGEVVLKGVTTIASREIAYGEEFYKWGLPLPLLVLLPFTRLYLRLTRRMKPFQQKSLTSYFYNAVGYLRAMVNRRKRYSFHKDYARMRVLQLYREFTGAQGRGEL